MTQEFTKQLAKWEMHMHQLGYRKVVLCKDCKYHWDDDRCEMMPNMIETDDDWWCADGERKSE